MKRPWWFRSKRVPQETGRQPQTEMGRELLSMFTSGPDRFPLRTVIAIGEMIRLVEDEAAETATRNPA